MSTLLECQKSRNKRPPLATDWIDYPSSHLRISISRISDLGSIYYCNVFLFALLFPSYDSWQRRGVIREALNQKNVNFETPRSGDPPTPGPGADVPSSDTSFGVCTWKIHSGVQYKMMR
jgi:hypothetical protein